MSLSAKHLLKASVMIGLMSGLGACARDMNYTGAETPKRNEVHMVRMVHDIHFNASQGLSNAEKTRLHVFLNTINVQYGDRLSADLGDNPQPAFKAALIAELKSRGLSLQTDAVVSGALPQAGSGRVVVDRYTVSLPQCKPLQDQAVPDRNDAEGINFGCASTSLLGLMVADKRDLVEGKTDTPADAGQATNAVKQSRTPVRTQGGGLNSAVSGSNKN